MNRISVPELNNADAGWSDALSPSANVHALAPSIVTLEAQRAMIDRSRRRSVAYGLTENAQADFDPARRADLALLLEQNRALCKFALPVMEMLFEQIIQTHSMVVLTDANGTVLHSLSDDAFLEHVDKVALQPGMNWSEEHKGTNAIGTAIAERAPVLVHAAEHYLHANHVITCSAAPIFDYQGNLAGVLDVTGDSRSFHRHTLALVRLSAQIIENQLFSAASAHAITLHVHTRPELIGTLMEGILSFSPDGSLLSANRAASFQLGLPQMMPRSHTFGSIFGLPVSVLFDHHHSAAASLLDLRLRNGMRIFARAEMRLNAGSGHADATIDGPQESPAQAKAMAWPPARATRPPASLRSLNTGDPTLASAIEKVSKVLGRDIPILVTGETGTGKDLFAQAIHHASSHARGPFVAVNCASIPENLIESELLGYEDGAFTGARKTGRVGKIAQANGGTLFLDEIGDMPLQLQARLLRVLEDRMVTPLGSNKSVAVNCTVISATHRNLRDLIAKGLFREDLYYRLNGLVIKLPPLRERTDIELLIRKLLAAESSDGRYTVSPDTLRLFKQYHWPGNIRQLSSLLRTAAVIADDDREISREHLPDDFLEDVSLLVPNEATAPAEIGPAVGTKLGNLEISMIRQTLAAHNGNVSAAARVLGISRNTVYRKLQVKI